MKERFKTISAIHLFFIKNDQVLLSRRYNTGYQDGSYSVPAGHVEEGESVIQAGVREALEEVGVRLSEGDLEFGHVMHRKSDRVSLDFFFICRNWHNEPLNCEPEKCDELRWVPLKQLPTNTIPYVVTALEKALNGEKYSELGW